MEIVKIIWWNVLSIVLARARCAVGLEDIKNSSSSAKYLDIFPGFRLTVEDDELRIKLNMEEMFPVTAVQSRSGGGDGDGNNKNDKKNPGIIKKFGSMMMMIPLIMQMMSIPAAVASLKMSLLRSIFVAKLAIIVMIYNLLKNQPQPSKTVVIYAAPAHHDHFYNSHIDEEPEGHDQGWFG